MLAKMAVAECLRYLAAGRICRLIIDEPGRVQQTPVRAFQLESWTRR